jgi:DNA processing protein
MGNLTRFFRLAKEGGILMKLPYVWRKDMARMKRAPGDLSREIYWVALNIVLAERPSRFKKVLEKFSNLPGAFQAPREELLSIGLNEAETEELSSPKNFDRAQKEIDRARKKGYSLLTLEDVEYPAYLREIFDPPGVLYCAGRLEALQGPAVAIVGTRRPSPYGRAVAEKLAEDLASRGVVIVSGLALGIDSIAHWGALKGGRTVAVLGSGLDNMYPKQNRKLSQKIMENGAVVSEFPLDAPPYAQHFPRRNRIISGLAYGVVIVEAAMKSGSLITAQMALEQNREVMAVPGSVTSELSKGTNGLIKTGAKLVETWEDVAQELPTPLREKLLGQREGETRPLPLLTDQEAEIYKLLRVDELTHVDELVDKCPYSVSELLALLLNLEIKGLILQSPGKYFQRRM